MNFNYQLRYSKTGRARFISHLDTLSCLARAIRRTGFELAFTQGMRPKPILSLAMPLGVGVEGEDEICDFSLRQRAPLNDLARKLQSELPRGMALKSVGLSFDRAKAASRVESCGYRIDLDSPATDYADAVNSYNLAGELIILRKRPKGDKEVDIKKYVESLDLAEGGGLCFTMKVTAKGTARPDEIVRALSDFSGKELRAARIVRTGIELAEEEQPSAPGYGNRSGRIAGRPGGRSSGRHSSRSSGRHGNHPGGRSSRRGRS